MATSKESPHGATPEDTLSREEYSDFALVLKNGRELLCHKVKLAEVSPVFRAMLRQNCAETQSNKMKVTEFEPDTVESFLDYVYADFELVPVKDTYQKVFYTNRLTAELLRMCHMYRVKNLQDKCVQHLQKSISDTNVVDIWAAAEMISDDELKKVALEHLVKKQSQLTDVPGLKESFNHPQLVESLVSYMSAQISLPPPLPACDDINQVIILNIICNQSGWEYLPTIQVQVKQCYTVKILRLVINEELARQQHGYASPGGPVYKCRMGSIKGGAEPLLYACLDENRTLASYSIGQLWTLHCEVYYSLSHV